MNTLHVRSVPDDLYQRLQQLARARNRSLSAQVVEMLGQALAEEERRAQQPAPHRLAPGDGVAAQSRNHTGRMRFRRSVARRTLHTIKKTRCW